VSIFIVSIPELHSKPATLDGGLTGIGETQSQPRSGSDENAGTSATAIKSVIAASLNFYAHYSIIPASARS
jgi:hypothetical protein